MSAHPKHPLRKIYESGAEPVDLQACKGMTSRPDAFQAAVERLEAAEREKERAAARILKQWKERQQKFCKRLYDTLWHFRVTTSQLNLPFAVTDPPRMSYSGSFRRGACLERDRGHSPDGCREVRFRWLRPH